MLRKLILILVLTSVPLSVYANSSPSYTVNIDNPQYRKLVMGVASLELAGPQGNNPAQDPLLQSLAQEAQNLLISTLTFTDLFNVLSKEAVLGKQHGEASALKIVGFEGIDLSSYKAIGAESMVFGKFVGDYYAIGLI